MDRLFDHKQLVKNYLDHKYGHVVYQLRADYHLNNDQNDDNNNPSDSELKMCQNQSSKTNPALFDDEHFYQIDNYLYKPNV